MNSGAPANGAGRNVRPPGAPDASDDALLPGFHKGISVFSVDVEDWFHILDLPTLPKRSEWDVLPSRVEKNFLRLLDLFAEREVKVTCFFLGWVARKFPHLVKEADARGHEIASHGDAHKLTYQMSAEEFLQDAKDSKNTLEDIAGRRVFGYRAAGFSVTESTDWFFDKLIEAGYIYDSSVFPAPRGHGGMRDGKRGPHLVITGSGKIVEFPMTVEPVLGRPLCFFGGGYLRFFPYAVIRHMTRKVLGQGMPVVFYVHPREIDPEHPRLEMSLQRRFKSYVNLASTEKKIRSLLSEFELIRFRDLLGCAERDDTSTVACEAAPRIQTGEVDNRERARR
jgi:polysaccharide deacetylase family protein (PEP-CTERM system associated)